MAKHRLSFIRIPGVFVHGCLQRNPAASSRQVQQEHDDQQIKDLEAEIVEYFITKFKDKMKGSSYQTAMGWVNGIKELDDDQKEKVKKGIMNMVTHKPKE
jgi:hypothetical protein